MSDTDDTVQTYRDIRRIYDFHDGLAGKKRMRYSAVQKETATSMFAKEISP